MSSSCPLRQILTDHDGCVILDINDLKGCLSPLQIHVNITVGDVVMSLSGVQSSVTVIHPAPGVLLGYNIDISPFLYDSLVNILVCLLVGPLPWRNYNKTVLADGTPGNIHPDMVHTEQTWLSDSSREQGLFSSIWETFLGRYKTCSRVSTWFGFGGLHSWFCRRGQRQF